MGQNYDDKRIREIEKAIGDVTNLENESIADAIGDMALMDGSSITDAIGDMSMLEGSTLVDKILSGGGGGGSSFTKYTGIESVSFPATLGKNYIILFNSIGSTGLLTLLLGGKSKYSWEQTPRMEIVDVKENSGVLSSFNGTKITLTVPAATECIAFVLELD